MSEQEVCWELRRKILFILSASGKPIFSNFGDEQEMVITFGSFNDVWGFIFTHNTITPTALILSHTPRLLFHPPPFLLLFFIFFIFFPS